MQTRTAEQTLAPTRSSVKLAALSMMAAGAILVFFTGFAGSEVLHDAAHDTRHSLAFPCH